ncbi:TPA: hypothetical protein ACH3X1_012914 [Trebouxia sp. C0004]
MATSAPGLQPSVASSFQTSSSDKKTNAEWKRYFEVLMERKKAADKWQRQRQRSRLGLLRAESRLGLLRAEKLVFVSSAAKVKQKDLRSMEEKELELLCTSVNEEFFGSALADCVLVRDFP